MLVVGGSGLLGRELVRQFVADGGRVAGTYRTRPVDLDAVMWRAMDVRDRRQVAGLVTAIRPDVIVNAAYQQADWATTADGAAHGAEALSRYDLGLLIARRDGIDPAVLPAGARADTGPPEPLDIRLDCTITQQRLHTRLRGAGEFLT